MTRRQFLRGGPRLWLLHWRVVRGRALPIVAVILLRGLDVMARWRTKR